MTEDVVEEKEIWAVLEATKRPGLPNPQTLRPTPSNRLMIKNGSITAAGLISSDPDPFKWRMGVKPLELFLVNWLLLDEQRPVRELEEIGQLIDRYRDDIIYCEQNVLYQCAKN